MRSLTNERIARAVQEAAEAAHKKYPESELMRDQHIMLAAAIKLSHRTHAQIEGACGIGRRVLMDQLNRERGDRHVVLPVYMNLLHRPEILGKEVHAWFFMRHMELLKKDGVLEEVVRTLDAVELETLDAHDASGFMAAVVREARSPESELGAGISPNEASKIAASAEVVKMEAEDVVRSAEREAVLA